MNDVGERSPASPAPGAEPSLAELRRLLLGIEQRQIAHLTERMDDPIIRAHEVASVLPDAVRARTQRDARLTEALQPTISTALEHAVTHDPGPFANALFPVLGPAIRAAVGDMLSRALSSLDAALTNTFSIRGLGWRLEAWRTGRPFAEVVLLRTLVFRVEQLILIDRMTGLPLQHLLADDVRHADADARAAMMSGMLTAIRDFVHDAFGASPSQTLDAFTVGDLRVWIEQGPRGLLAAVVRGNPPSDLRMTLREINEELHLQFGTAFARFDGDAAPFELARPTLERAFASRYTADAKPKSMARAWTVVALALLTLALLAGWWWYRGYRFDEYVARLRAEPGIVVTEAERDGLGFRLVGLRDPDATTPAMLRIGIPVDTTRLQERWAPYLSLDSTLTLLRTSRRLQPPARALLALRGDTIIASGSARSAWRDSARTLALATPGVRVWSDAALQLDVRARADSLAASVMAERITFPIGSAVLREGDVPRLRAMGQRIRALSALVPVEGGALSVAVDGYTDLTGSDTLNARLSVERAAAVRAVLVAEGVEGALFQFNGSGKDNGGAPASNASTTASRVALIRPTIQWDAIPSRP